MASDQLIVGFADFKQASWYSNVNFTVTLCGKLNFYCFGSNHSRMNDSGKNLVGNALFKLLPR